LGKASEELENAAAALGKASEELDKSVGDGRLGSNLGAELPRARSRLKAQLNERLEERREQPTAWLSGASRKLEAAFVVGVAEGRPAASAALTQAQAAAAAAADTAINGASPEAQALLDGASVEARALLVRYAPEVQAAVRRAQAEIVPRLEIRGSQLLDSLSSLTPSPRPGVEAFDGTLSIGSIRLRAGMPLTELSPQLPRLTEEISDEMMRLGQQLQESSQGSVLLDGLAAAATDAAKASSEAYAAAAGGVAAQEGPQTAEAAQQETQEAWAGLEQRAQ